MLTSSDAKWRCLWHMFVWSVLLTLVSQFLTIFNHVAFYIISGMSMIGLPILTAVYSNTSGKHGANLLRVGYVLCDPVISCITITPILIFNKLPAVITSIMCIRDCHDVNSTLTCVENSSHLLGGISEASYDREGLMTQMKGELLVIQGFIVLPSLIALLMGPRTQKMKLTTYLICFLVWLVTSIEAVDLIEYTLIKEEYQHNIFTTETTVSIVTILTHSYAVVTLCSYISPANKDYDQKLGYSKKFDFLYQSFVVVSGVLFTEIPFVISRLRIMSVNFSHLLPAAFYTWLTKDIIFIFILAGLLIIHKLGHRKVTRLPCKLDLGTGDVVFQPEKRDEYIVKKRVRFQDPLFTSLDDIALKPPVCEITSEVKNMNCGQSLSHGSGLESLGKDSNRLMQRQSVVTNGSYKISGMNKKAMSAPLLTDNTAGNFGEFVMSNGALVKNSRFAYEVTENELDQYVQVR